MSFNGSWKMRPVNSADYRRVMAIFDMREKSSQIVERLWWKFMPSVEVILPWPVGDVRVRQEESGLWDHVRTADPNNHYRPWLEENVGKQRWDWDWKVYDDYTVGGSQVLLKIRRGKAQFATMAALKWK
jgi:hypothetical protein